MTTEIDLEAVIFDMDGVLIDSEPLWQRAEIDLFGDIGVTLTPEQCASTMGLRIDEVVNHWRDAFPWGNEPSNEAMVDRIVTEMVELIGSQGRAIEGAQQAVRACRELGLRVALATSSYEPIMIAALDTLELTDAFEVTHSGQNERYAKPHPAIYLGVAELLGVEPLKCLCVEDSVAGVIAAKAARMTCVAIPDIAKGDPRFVLADAVLGSVNELPTYLEDVVPVDVQDRQ